MFPFYGLIIIGKNGYKYGFGKDFGSAVPSKIGKVELLSFYAGANSIVIETSEPIGESISLTLDVGISTVFTNKNGKYVSDDKDFVKMLQNHTLSVLNYKLDEHVHQLGSNVIDAINNGFSNAEIKKAFGLTAKEINLLRKEIEDGSSNLSDDEL